jgi:hypothetical protein
MFRRTHRLAVIAVAAAFVGAAPAAAQGHSVAPSVSAVAAKSCSSGYTHAVIGGSHRCLRRGQFCSRSSDRSYHRYGFHCHTGRLR